MTFGTTLSIPFIPFGAIKQCSVSNILDPLTYTATFDNKLYSYETGAELPTINFSIVGGNTIFVSSTTPIGFYPIILNS